MRKVSIFVFLNKDGLKTVVQYSENPWVFIIRIRKEMVPISLLHFTYQI